ncbi:hypothetical protein OH77DRAFT_1494404 [Trametes cingulata]|nr:hypothetical protein OH77DRAFT_1494404 [Trametes cingulata]
MLANLSELPVELLNTIGQHAPARDLHSLLLANKHLNEALTPALYSAVTIDNYDAARKYIRTLATDPADVYARRDLAALVRSLNLKFEWYGMPQAIRAKLARRLARAFARTTHLQHLVFRGTYVSTPRVWAALVRAAAPTLRSLDADLDMPRWWPDGSTADVLEGPPFPQLSALTLYVSDDLPREWLGLLEHVLTSRAAHLRALKVPFWEGPLTLPLLRKSPAWSALRTLEIGGSSLVDLAALPPAPNLRSLTLNYTGEEAAALGSTVIPHDLYPHLEVLACPYQLLPAFFPADVPRYRPVHTVRLDRAAYDEDGGGYGDFAQGEQPEWEDVREALSCLPRSAGPVRDLSFFLDWFDAETFGAELAEYVGSLERLLIVLYQDPGNEPHLATLGETLFAHTPRLHTFLLSDAPYKFSDSSTAFFFAWDRKKQLRWLEEWGKHTGALRKVAFTTEFVWRKTADGWTAPERKDEDSSDEEDDEDENEDSEEESEGSVAAAEEQKDTASLTSSRSQDSSDEDRAGDEDDEDDDEEDDNDDDNEVDEEDGHSEDGDDHEDVADANAEHNYREEDSDGDSDDEDEE